jgi:hypothetical protein
MTPVSRHAVGVQPPKRAKSMAAILVSAALASAAALPALYLASAPPDVGSSEERTPELGSARLPEIVREDFSVGRQQLGARSRPTTPEPSDGHLLARTQTANGETLSVFGTSDAAAADCTAVFLAEGAPTSPQCGSAGSPPAAGFDGILRATLGREGTEVLSGTAPPGTAYVLLRSGGRELRVDAFRAGSNRGGRAFFVAEWPVAANTTLEAYNGGGRSLATATDSPFNP